jgi:hypothetical protein
MTNKTNKQIFLWIGIALIWLFLSLTFYMALFLLSVEWYFSDFPAPEFLFKHIGKWIGPNDLFLIAQGVLSAFFSGWLIYRIRRKRKNKTSRCRANLSRG